MQVRYAQLIKKDDGFGYIVSDSKLSGYVEKENMIEVPMDFNLQNKRWNYEKEAWEEFTPQDDEITWFQQKG